MTKLFKQVVSLAAVATFAVSLASCKKDVSSDEIDPKYEWLDTSISDTSDLSSYSGSTQLDLVGWSATQTGGDLKKDSSEDVVSAEIKRVTGVSVSKSSFDNGGMVATEKFKQLLTTKSIPDFVYGSGGLSAVDPSYLWDLTDLIKTYCPTILERIPDYVWDYCKIDGKIYGIPYMLANATLETLDPEVANMPEGNSTIMFSRENDYYPFIYVRDDVLKEAYPNAHTQDELDAIFAKNGKFTEDEIFDVKITSAEQFRTEFLPKIQEVLSSKKYYVDASGRRVETMVLHTGYDYDTWDFMGVLVPQLLGATGNHYNTHFSYWDVSTQKIELMMNQQFYKDEMYEWAKLLSEGKIVSQNGFDAAHSSMQGDYNSGRYAIGYFPNSYPAGEKATYASSDGTTKTVNYRKVYLKIEKDDEHFEFWSNETATPETVSFFKSKVNEKNLPQILRWMDYQCSRLADKLYGWGPRSAGLFTESADGVRTFKDENLANQMVYATSAVGDLVQKYNLGNGTFRTPQPTFPFVYMNASIYHPKCSYDLSSMKGMSAKYYSPTRIIQKKSIPMYKMASLHANWSNRECDGIEALWAKRPAIELKLEQLIKAGSSKSVYETAYKGLTDTLVQQGWTNAYFNGKFTNAFLALNEKVLDEFYKKK